MDSGILTGLLLDFVIPTGLLTNPIGLQESSRNRWRSEKYCDKEPHTGVEVSGG